MTIAVCDDNKVFLSEIRDKICNILDSENTLYDILLFDTGVALLKTIQTTRFDIILLDIDMPDLNGKQLAHDLRAIAKNRFKLIFVSDFSEEVFSTFEYDIESFIPKNKLDEYLAHELKRIVALLRGSERPSFAFHYYDNKHTYTCSVYVDEIMYIEILNGDVYIQTVNEYYRLYKYRFDTIREQFLPYGFIDIHRTCIVNVTYISKIKSDYIVLKNNMQLPLSRRKRKAVDKALMQYIKDQVI